MDDTTWLMLACLVSGVFSLAAIIGVEQAMQRLDLIEMLLEEGLNAPPEWPTEKESLRAD